MTSGRRGRRGDAQGRRIPGFSVIELLLVVAIVSILSAIAVPLYVGWRADALNREVLAVVQNAIIDARQEARRLTSDAVVSFANPSAISVTVGPDVRTIPLPTGVTLAPVDAAVDTVVFDSILGAQSPYEAVQFDVTTGSLGPLQRTARLTVLPPLGKTASAAAP